MAVFYYLGLQLCMISEVFLRDRRVVSSCVALPSIALESVEA